MPADRFLDTNILLYAYDLDAQGEDIDNAKLYEELTGGLARINIECTLQLRSAKDGSGDSAESKKNSRPKRVRSASPKQKPLSRKPKRA